MNEPQEFDEEEEPPVTGGYHWHVLVIGGALVMGLLAMSLWRRVMQVDPVERCAHAYESSYNAVDTSLVDRIKVRSPDGNGHVYCEVLRKNGAVNTVLRPGRMERRRMP